MALHAEFRFGVRLFREPDAGNPPVRFDEREEETEPSQTGMRRRGKSPANRHREATVTAPLLDSTHNPLAGTRTRAFLHIILTVSTGGGSILPSVYTTPSNEVRGWKEGTAKLPHLFGSFPRQDHQNGR